MGLKMSELTVDGIIEDVKRRNYYCFTIKPSDEDEQHYTPPFNKSPYWGMLAFCFMGRIKTPDLLHRLENRQDAEVIKTEKSGSQLLITEEG